MQSVDLHESSVAYETRFSILPRLGHRCGHWVMVVIDGHNETGWAVRKIAVYLFCFDVTFVPLESVASHHSRKMMQTNK